MVRINFFRAISVFLLSMGLAFVSVRAAGVQGFPALFRSGARLFSTTPVRVPEQMYVRDRVLVQPRQNLLFWPKQNHLLGQLGSLTIVKQKLYDQVELINNEITQADTQIKHGSGWWQKLKIMFGGETPEQKKERLLEARRRLQERALPNIQRELEGYARDLLNLSERVHKQPRLQEGL